VDAHPNRFSLNYSKRGVYERTAGYGTSKEGNERYGHRFSTSGYGDGPFLSEMDDGPVVSATVKACANKTAKEGGWQCTKVIGW